MRLLHPWMGVPVGPGVAVDDGRGVIPGLDLFLVRHCRVEVNRCRLALLLAGNEPGGEFRHMEVPIARTAGPTIRKSRIGDSLEADRGQGWQVRAKLQGVHRPTRVRAADE